MANELAIWGLVYSLLQGMPAVHEEVILPRGEGCYTFCVAYKTNAQAWAARHGLDSRRAGNCACVLVRECQRADCSGEQLLTSGVP